MLSPLQGVVLAVIVLVAIVVMVVIAAENSRRRRQRLQRQFGPEYARAVEQYGTVRQAEKELLARARRWKRFRLHELNDADRIHFGNAWAAVQTKFVDNPSAAVNEANRLIETVMQARGYPVEDFEHRVADLSVDHAHVVQHYRAARALAQANQEGRANTEELRQAFVHYRALFTELLSEADVEPATLRPLRA